MKTSWIDNIDEKIIPYINQDDYEVRYPTLSAYEMQESERKELQNLSANIVMCMSKLVEDIRKNSDIFPIDVLNMTPKLTPFIRDDNSEYVSNIARLDFVKDMQGNFKLVEINADTPCAIPETFYGNEVAREYFNAMYLQKVIDKTVYPETIFDNLICASYDELKHPLHICFAANKNYAEDWANASFYKTLTDEFLYDIPYVSDAQDITTYLVDLKEMVIKDDGVYVGDVKIDILYRLHPIELLMDDTSDDGYPVGLKLMDLANQGKVILVNPIKAILMQNKAMLAVAQYAAQHTDYFNQEAFRYINILTGKSSKDTMLFNIAPTSMDIADFKGSKIIKKPIFGREGCGISIIEPDGSYSYTAEETDDCNFIYQQFIESPTERVETDKGIWSGKFTYSCFVINTMPSEVFVRFSPYDIAGLEALWVPVIAPRGDDKHADN